MLTCPLCKKRLPALERRCRTCQADVSLLVDYVGHLQDGLSRADMHTRRGELSAAVWAYLEVLDVEPGNAKARQEGGAVGAGVRQFDRSAAQSWRRLDRKGSFMRSITNFGLEGAARGWFVPVLWTGGILLTLVIGYGLGYYQGSHQANPPDQTTPASP